MGLISFTGITVTFSNVKCLRLVFPDCKIKSDKIEVCRSRSEWGRQIYSTKDLPNLCRSWIYSFDTTVKSEKFKEEKHEVQREIWTEIVHHIENTEYLKCAEKNDHYTWIIDALTLFYFRVVFFPFGISTIIRRKAGWEASASRHYGGLVEDCLKLPSSFPPPIN